MNGTVTDVSDDRGLGTVTDDEGETFPFHVIEIADGSRTVEIGQRVRFRKLPKFGTFEAAEIHKV